MNEAFPKLFSLISFLPCVSLMYFQIRICLNRYMSVQVMLTGETFLAFFALIQFLPCVNLHMCIQVSHMDEGFASFFCIDITSVVLEETQRRSVYYKHYNNIFL